MYCSVLVVFAYIICLFYFMLLLYIRQPPRSTPFPTRRSSDLVFLLKRDAVRDREGELALRPLHVDLVRLHGDRKSTRLNSSHQIISYAVFCLKKKKKKTNYIKNL